MNNLYGTSMSEPLPLNGFKWLNENEFQLIDWSSISDESDVGYILEVDLEYCENLHDLHSDFPLAPIKRKINTTELSDYQKSILERMNSIGINYRPTEKLILDLHDKKKYVLHYRNLKLYLFSFEI